MMDALSGPDSTSTEKEPQLINDPFELHSINKILTSLEAQREWRLLSRRGTLKALGDPFDRPTTSITNLKQTDETDAQVPQKPASVPSTIPSRPYNFISNFLGSQSSISTLGKRKSKASVIDWDLVACESSQRDGGDDQTTCLNPANKPQDSQLPLLRIWFQRVFGALPGLKDAPIETWIGIQSIIDDFNRRNFSTSRERKQLTKRAVISIGYTKFLSTYWSSILRFEEGDGRPSRPDNSDFQLINDLPRAIIKFGSRIKVSALEDDRERHLILFRRKRTSMLKDQVLSSDTSQSSAPFKPALAEGVMMSLIDQGPMIEFLQSIDLALDNTRHNDRRIIKPSVVEKYLIGLLDPTHHHHSKLEEFLKSSEIKPGERSKELDEFLKEENEFATAWVESGKKVHKVRSGYKGFIHRLIYEDEETDKLFKLAAEHPLIESVLTLDPTYGQALSWAILWLAYVTHFVFISGPDSEEVCELTIKFNKLIPYELIRQGLKVVNPTLAIKTVITLILGQPFGSLSLFQRIISSVLNHEIKTFNVQIESALKSMVTPQILDSRELYQAVYDYVYLPENVRLQAWTEFEKSQEDIMILILRKSNRYSEEQMLAIQESREEFQRNASPNMFHDLCLLLRLLCLKRDREQIIEMIVEPNNPIVRTIRSVVELYYQTIYQVALASDLPRNVAHSEAFMNELIKLLTRRKRYEVRVEEFMDLFERHKQSLWTFLHEVFKYKDLCQPIKTWIKNTFDLIKYGLRKPCHSELGSEPTIRLRLNFQNMLRRLDSDRIDDQFLEEARFLSNYDRYLKMIDEIHYRSVFSPSTVSSIFRQTDFLSQSVQILSIQDNDGFGKYLNLNGGGSDQQYRALRWAWWVNEPELCGAGGETLAGADRSTDSHVDNIPCLNSNLDEMKKLSESYIAELMLHADSFDRSTKTNKAP